MQGLSLLPYSRGAIDSPHVNSQPIVRRCITPLGEGM